MTYAWMLGSHAASAIDHPLTIEVHSDDLVTVAVSFDSKETLQPATPTHEKGGVKFYTCQLPESFSVEGSRVKVEAIHKLPGGGQQYRQFREVDRQDLKSRVLQLQGHPGRILLEDFTYKVTTVHLQFKGDNGVTLIGSTQRIQLSNLVMHCELPSGNYRVGVSLDGEHWSTMKQPLVVDSNGSFSLNQSEFAIGELSLNPKVECEVLSFLLTINTLRPLITSFIYPDSRMHFTCGDALRIHANDGIAQYRCKLYAKEPMDSDELDRCCVTISADPSPDNPMGVGNESYQYLAPRNGRVRDLDVRLFGGSIVLPFPAEKNSDLFYVISKGSDEYASDLARRVQPDGRLVHWSLPVGRYELSVYDPRKMISSHQWDLVLDEGGEQIQVLKKKIPAGPIEQQAEPAGAGQPANKSADNVPAKIQPSTPTSKDAPR